MPASHACDRQLRYSMPLMRRLGMAQAAGLFCQGYGALRYSIDCLIDGTSQQELAVLPDRAVSR
jgi:hypothetical protein